jgi:predicted DNA binding CopG/RHH family protein
MKAAARATAIKDQRINIRLSRGDLHDIQAKAL